MSYFSAKVFSLENRFVSRPNLSPSIFAPKLAIVDGKMSKEVNFLFLVFNRKTDRKKVKTKATKSSKAIKPGVKQ